MVVASGSPRITRFSWGQIEVEGYETTFKDVKLFPGGARESDWGETGTQHSPGIQIEDIEEILKQQVEVIVLAKGVLGRLKICEETLLHLDSRGIEVEVWSTRKAVRVYNALAADRPVGGLIHSTC